MSNHPFRDKSADSNIQSYSLINTLSQNMNQSNQMNPNSNTGQKAQFQGNSVSLNFSFKANNKNKESSQKQSASVNANGNKNPNSNSNLNQNPENANLSKNTLVNIIDSLNLNKSIVFKDEGSVLFRKKIDKLNLKFYIETDKYLHSQGIDKPKCQDQLFIILFKQITLYNEEVERLNIFIREQQHKSTLITTVNSAKQTVGINDEIKDVSSLENLIDTLRKSNHDLQNLVNEKISENKHLKQEIETMKRQIKFFKEKLQIDLNASFGSVLNSSCKNSSAQNFKDFKSNNENGSFVSGISQGGQSQTGGNSNTTHTNVGSGGATTTAKHKKNISSDKFLLSVSQPQETKDKLPYRPTLSLTNFNKKPQKTSLNLASSQASQGGGSGTGHSIANNILSSSYNNTGSFVQLNSSNSQSLHSSQQVKQSSTIADSFATNTETSKNDKTSSDASKTLPNTSSKTFGMKKRNHSDNDPNSTLNKKVFGQKENFELIRDRNDRGDYLKSKLNIQEVVKLNNAANSSMKKPLVSKEFFKFNFA